ncbi:arsenate reductase ArsC [Stenotrophomonas sp. GD03908]|uniref:arsenate reductase ArsC n=1 Tax=Stenotrophomonas TaxID=40323 RepID=UPI000C157D99|nr:MULTISPECIES: arsenate reductase ArsC [Stenotrophomonas]MBH1481061.1 arsenate reductase ArsC [Stenotrophomonas maltophilia]MDH0978266.1 arsenate reductase ArsC [Stenotrophomonas sp. GD03908]MDQ7292985.1 arsenate reductase ArsC [Stenotrophomonas sp. Sm0041]
MTRRVLFLCTGNSARSVLAESTLKRWGEGRYLSFSAGSQPTGRVNPFAIAQLEREGFPVEGMRSKSWDEFAETDAAAMDLIVTVCDSAAAEACPVVFGDFVRVHWGLFDPAAVDGSDAQKAEAFDLAHQIIKRRLQAFLDIPDSAWDDREALKARLDPIAQID